MEDRLNVVEYHDASVEKGWVSFGDGYMVFVQLSQPLKHGTITVTSSVQGGVIYKEDRLGAGDRVVRIVQDGLTIYDGEATKDN